MLESLTDKMNQALRSLRGLSRLSEENMAEALKEVRNALLSADVHFKVVRQFVDQVQSQCVGQSVLKDVSPGQQVVKIIHDELVKLLGEGSAEFTDKKPLRVMLVGLQGSGKTTTAAKLSLLLRKKGFRPGLVACDVYRPAAIDQLETLAKQQGFASFSNRETKDVVRIAKDGDKALRSDGTDLVVFDTAGRLQIDTDLVNELIRLKAAIQPEEVLLVVTVRWVRRQ